MGEFHAEMEQRTADMLARLDKLRVGVADQRVSMAGLAAYVEVLATQLDDLCDWVEEIVSSDA